MSPNDFIVTIIAILLSFTFLFTVYCTCRYWMLKKVAASEVKISLNYTNDIRISFPDERGKRTLFEAFQRVRHLTRIKKYNLPEPPTNKTSSYTAGSWNSDTSI